MKNKRLILIIVMICISCTIIFGILKILHYKNSKTGNNIADKTLQEIESYILNISSYSAKIEVNVESNKNSNKYIINQKFVKPNICKQEVIEPKNIEGLTIKYDGNNLEISNTKLNLTTIYENYEYVADNVLWLSDFIENYKESNGKISEDNGVIVMEAAVKHNAYSVKEKLYIDRNANTITKMVVEDENSKTKIYITYKEIEIDSLNQNNVMAFKLEKIEKTKI